MSLTISVPSVIRLLKEETHASHELAENLLLPKLMAIRSHDDYAAILKMFYGYFEPLEKVIAAFVTKDILEDAHERRNAQLIIDDLRAMNALSGMPLCSKLPAIGSLYDALGAMYVLEGSTLGGRMITKMLLNNSALSAKTCVRFFSGYGEATGQKWLSFQSVLDQYSAHAPAIVQAADKTFDCLGNWIRKTLYHENEN